jgi:Tfp pilus assembly pilus retraction ATPase PilT
VRREPGLPMYLPVLTRNIKHFVVQLCAELNNIIVVTMQTGSSKSTIAQMYAMYANELSCTTGLRICR